VEVAASEAGTRTRASGSGSADGCGEQALVFKLPLTKVQVDFPWYYLSGGLKLRSGTHEYRLSFGQPSNTRMPVDKPKPLKAATRAFEEFSEVVKMRRVGKAWQEALSGR